jgi:hypothetical protein
MFRPCWVILREKLSVVVTVGCTIQLSENVLLTVHCAAYGDVNALWSRLVLHISGVCLECALDTCLESSSSETVWRKLFGWT